jgi:hypothetical protein
MGLFFNRQEFTGLGLQDKVNDLELEIAVLKAKMDNLVILIPNEVAKQIQSAKAVEKAHEKHPSLSKRIKVKRYSGTFAQTYYDRPFQIAMEMQDKFVQREIADKLNEYGFKTPQGNEFRQGNVSDMLQNKWLLSRFHKFEQKHGKLHAPVDFIHGLS